VNFEQLTKFLHPHLLLFWHQVPWPPLCVVRALTISLPFQLRMVSHGFSTIPFRSFPSIDDLQTSVCELACTVPKTGLLHPSGIYQKDDNNALTSAGSRYSILKCDYAAFIISQPVFQVSPNLRTALISFNCKLGNCNLFIT
jgi:hypothetical protein